MLEVESISKTFVKGVFRKERVTAVREVSFCLPGGETLGIVGNSGCGKSTVARILLSLVPPDSGSVRLDGEDLLNPDRKISRARSRKIQIIFQHPESSLDPAKRIGYSLKEPMRLHRMYDEKERNEKVRRLMELVELDERLLGRFPHQLSGGEAQRVMIARALTLEPKVLVLDEPTSMLDVSVQAQVMSVLKGLQKRMGLSYVFISHDISLVSRLCGRIAVMRDGCFVETGETRTVLSAPNHEFTRELLESSRLSGEHPGFRPA